SQVLACVARRMAGALAFSPMPGRPLLRILAARPAGTSVSRCTKLHLRRERLPPCQSAQPLRTWAGQKLRSLRLRRGNDAQRPRDPMGDNEPLKCEGCRGVVGLAPAIRKILLDICADVFVEPASPLLDRCDVLGRQFWEDEKIENVHTELVPGPSAVLV